MRELRFHREARAELVAAAEHHEAERPGYGERFREEMRKLVEQAAELPATGQREAGYPAGVDVRTFRFRVFPYSLVVSIEPEMVLVVAVTHGRRRPGYWRDRLE
ncbi:MAG: type II toxin-antitoxin system RelE/ParE family toxin [Sandaracinaceae bacterium]|nr:type II toxin-antitoxin system RelE/ParE family toxin [Sandaracinaceae bacterium]